MRKEAQDLPKKESLFEEERDQEEAAHPREEKERKRRKNYLILFLAVILAFTSIQIGLYARSHNHIPEMRTAEPGYLSLKEYVLINSETGEKTQILTNADYTDQSTFTYGFNQYETLRGIKPGDTWDSFVKAYGDCIPWEIRIYRGKGKEAINVEPGITVEQFDQKYMKSGLLNFAEDDVDIYFFTGTDGMNLYYSQEQFEEKQDQFNDSPRILHPLQKYDDFAGYRLGFHFYNSYLTEGDLQMISSYRID